MDSKDDGEHVVMNDNVAKATDQAETARVIDKAAERRLCLKYDVRLLPVLALMCKSRFSDLPLAYLGNLDTRPLQRP